MNKNDGSRFSERLEVQHARSMIYAIQVAFLLDLPMNRWITIDIALGLLKQMGATWDPSSNCWRRPNGSVVDVNSADWHYRCRDAAELVFARARDWLRDRKVEIAYIGVLENTITCPCEGEPPVGIHLHFIIHVPFELGFSFDRHLRGWVRQAGMKQLRKKNMQLIRTLQFSSGETESNKFVYMLKTADLPSMGLGGFDSECDGGIYGKRHFVAKKISPNKLEETAAACRAKAGPMYAWYRLRTSILRNEYWHPDDATMIRYFEPSFADALAEYRAHRKQMCAASFGK